jgi:D-alanyl-D-alanine carboxypeptidase
MTLLKQKLEAAMTEWNKPKKHLFTPTNNVTRASFEKARDNPGHTRQELVNMLTADGFKETSTSSILSALVRQGQLRSTEGKLYAISSTYKPLKSNSTLKSEAKPVKQVKAAPQPKPTQQVKAERVTVDLDEWINEVSLMQARMVYIKLKAIFESAP